MIRRALERWHQPHGRQGRGVQRDRSDPHAVDNTGGGETPHAPCYPDRETITARELYEAASAGPAGSCTLADVIDDRGGESELRVREIRDGDVRVGTIDPCGVEVFGPRITDERGIAVGDTIDVRLTTAS